MQQRQEKTGKFAAVSMHPIWVAEIDAMPRRSVTILDDRQGKPFDRLEMLRDRINAVPQMKSVAAALDELDLSREEIGNLCGMTPEMVDLYTKKKQVYPIAQRLADRVVGAAVLGLPGPQARKAEKWFRLYNVVTPTGIEPVLQP